MFNIFQKIRRFDAYAKTVEEARVKTFSGAIVTLFSVTIIVCLFLIEFDAYLTPDVTEELFVDTSRSSDIQINLDFIIPQISCDFLALDAMDSSGEQHLRIDHNIYKRRLDLKGEPIEEPKKEDITIRVKDNNTQLAVPKTTNETECGSCYGASFDPKRCCNTCEEVREAYRERRWAFPDNPENISQCQHDKFSERLKTAFSQGCQIYGTLTVNRVSGSFHIAPGKSFSINHVHVHDVHPFSSTEFNTTHIIRHLSFGPRMDSETHNPLKNTVGKAEEGATMFQYHIKIVPTFYSRKDNTVIEDTNQFSVTKHRKVVSIINGESGMPGIFFQYELSPLMVKYTERKRSFGHFLTNVCAIIGGVYTVAGLIDTFMFHSLKLIQQKIELGKFN